VHAGSVPRGGTRFTPGAWVDSVDGRAAIGYFAHADGTPYLVVANSDSLWVRSIKLSLPGTHRACVISEDAMSWSTAPCFPVASGSMLRIDLRPGSFAVVRLEGPTVVGIPGGTAPGLRVSPQPARGMVELAITRLGEGGRVEIVDAAGRRAWGRSLAPGATRVVWRGERSEGGVSPPGLYFARVEDARGFRVERLVWLGAP
jgi:hypothetical protein